MSAAGVTSAAGLLVSRFMLGVMEAGIIYILMNETIKKKKKDNQKWCQGVTYLALTS